jgi:hypothetical protein
MAVNITQLVTNFNEADLQAYINDYTLGDLQYRRFFPTEYTPFLTFEALQADFSAKVAADVVAFDSRAPRKGRQLPGKVTGDIPKIEIAKVKKESDLNTYRQLQAAANNAVSVNARQAILRRIIDWTYGDSTAVLDGVNARMEWLAKQLTTTGSYTLTLVNNAGGVVTAVPVSFGIPGGNVSNATTDWDTTATATPIADIKARVATARAAGVSLRFAIMDQATFDRMVKTDEVQKFTASFAANALNIKQVPNLETVNTSLSAGSLPTIVIWESYINVESKAGALTATTGWTTGKVVLSPSLQLGTTQWTTTADDFVNIGAASKSNSDFVTVKVFAEEDPITMVTKGVAYATPVLNNAKAIYIITTDY